SGQGKYKRMAMSLGLVGRKIGMTRVFADDGIAVPVTVLDIANNRVTQIKTPENDGYAAVQVTFGKRRASRVTKPQAGHLAKAGAEAGELLKEFRIAADDLAKFKPGDVIGVDTFAVGQLVDVTGTTKGRGFTGVIQIGRASCREKGEVAIVDNLRRRRDERRSAVEPNVYIRISVLQYT